MNLELLSPLGRSLTLPVSIPIRDLMNLEPDAVKEYCRILVSIPIRDLMNLELILIM